MNSPATRSWRACALVLLLAAVPEAGQAASLRISGVAGYLSEWEFAGDVTEKASRNAKELSGPLIWKHVGLCSAKGPQEKTGEINLQISGVGASSRIDATLWLDGAQCKYSGPLSGGSSGLMDCANAGGVPFSLSFR